MECDAESTYLPRTAHNLAHTDMKLTERLFQTAACAWIMDDVKHVHLGAPLCPLSSSQ